MSSEAPSGKYPKLMSYVNLGNSGLRVSKIILGCMSYGSPEWQKWLLGEEEAMLHIKTAYDAGIQTFDTADTYSNGLSEEILGRAIKKFDFPREEIVVMTKLFALVGRPDDVHNVTFEMYGKNSDQYGYVNQKGLGRKHIFEAVKKSLERLQLDYIDVLQCHRFDPNTPIEETMTALHDVVKAGYVRYIGMSSCYAWQFFAMQTYALQHNLTPFISMQNHYNLAYREEEREMFPALKHFGVGSIPWSPLARGFLTRPYTDQGTTRAGSDPWAIGYGTSDGNKEVNKRCSQIIFDFMVPARNIMSRVEELAKKRGYTMAQIAAAWIMNKDNVTAPIFGTTSLKNLQDLIAAVQIRLSPEEMKYLEEPYQPMAVFGH